MGTLSNLIPNMVYSAHGEDVDTSIIDGKIVMQNRELKTVNEEKVIDQAKKTMESVAKKIF